MVSEMVLKIREAFQNAEALPDAEQETLTRGIIDSADATKRSRKELFSWPHVLSVFDRLGQETFAEYRRGETKPLDLDMV